MNILVEKGSATDIDQLSQLYDDLNDFLEGGINYPGWKKGIYPTRKEAANGVANDILFVAKISGNIVGSVILNHEPEPAYHKVKWNVDADYSNIFVVHTFVVHPAYLKNRIGTELMNYAVQHAMNEHAKSIRLDVYEHNSRLSGYTKNVGLNMWTPWIWGLLSMV